jgi:hypothetical protein
MIQFMWKNHRSVGAGVNATTVGVVEYLQKPPFLCNCLCIENCLSGAATVSIVNKGSQCFVTTRVVEYLQKPPFLCNCLCIENCLSGRAKESLYFGF